MKRQLVWFAAVSLCAGCGRADHKSRVSEADHKSWVGEAVLPTKPFKDIQLGDVGGGQQAHFPFSGRMPSKVLDDREGRLRIQDGSREGWADQDQFVPVRDAPAYFDRRVQADPKDTWALFMRGSIWLEKGEPDVAMKDFVECIRLDPTNADYYNARGAAWQDKKDSDRAIQDYDEAIRLDPKKVDTLYNRGVVWVDKKAYDKASKDYDEAFRLDPQYGAACNNLAWLLATCPDDRYRDGKRAVELARKACELSAWKNPYRVDTLAAAYAEAGRFDEAVHWQKKVLEAKDYERAKGEAARKRLKLYEAKQPFRDTGKGG
jgi:tetratricopeptide (TPR) repeat protein